MQRIDFAEIFGTRKMGDEESDLLTRKLNAQLKMAAGKSMPFLFSVGDSVMDTMTHEAGTVIEQYRQNGWNFYRINPALSGGVRERDLMRWK